LLAAVAVSMTGNSVRQLALPWYILTTTGSPARAGISAFVGSIAIAISGVLGGAFVDWLGFKRSSVLADLISGATVAAIPLLYLTVGLPFWALLSLVFVGRLMDSAGDAARDALTVDLAQLAKVSLDRANSLGEMATYIPYLIGPVVAGLVVAWAGASQAMWFDAASFAASASIVAVLVPAIARSRRVERRSYGAETLEGFRFIRGQAALVWLVGFSAATMLLVAALPGLILPVYVREAYGNAAALGGLVAAFAFGMALGIVAYPPAARRLGRRTMLVAGALGMGVASGAFALGAPFALGLLATLLAGASYGPSGPLFRSVVGERTPEHLRGRVFGASTAITTAGVPVGVLLVGFGLEAFGPRALLAGIAIALLALGAATAVNPAVRIESPRNAEAADGEQAEGTLGLSDEVGTPVGIRGAEERV
jgi:MFS family permease